MPTQTPKKSQGFTLIELLVVLVLGAMSVGVVGASAQAYMARAHYHESVKNLNTAIKQARMLSQQQGRSITLTYSAQTRQITVSDQVALVIPESVTVQWQALASPPQTPHPERRAADAEPIFVFNAEGGARGGHIELTRQAQAVRFQVNWLFGTVQMTAANT